MGKNKNDESDHKSHIETTVYEFAAQSPSKRLPLQRQVIHEEVEETNEENVNIKYLCNHCNATFDLEAEYKEHMKTHYEGRCQCSICFKEFQCSSECRRHETAHKITIVHMTV